jgi:hypothetical protein
MRPKFLLDCPSQFLVKIMHNRRQDQITIQQMTELDSDKKVRINYIKIHEEVESIVVLKD